jgi:hypothetical protein
MEQVPAEQFTRNRRRVRSPISERRSKRLIRLAIVCVAITAGAVSLLAMALN